MGHVVAILDQSTFKVFRDSDRIPSSAMVFSSWRDMSRVMSASVMDKVRDRLLGDKLPASISADEAAKRLWHVMMLGVDRIVVAPRFSPRLDKLGNKMRRGGRIELLQLAYSPGKSRSMDLFYKKLCPQGKIILNILIDDGRMIWTNEEAAGIVHANSDKIASRQSIAWLFNYYRSFFINYQLVKRVTYAELAKGLRKAGIK